MSFRKYGGIQFSATNNYVSSQFTTSNTMGTTKIGFDNTVLPSLSILNVDEAYIAKLAIQDYITFSDGSVQTTAYVNPLPGIPTLIADNVFTGSNTFNNLTIASTHSLIIPSTSNISVGTAPNGPTIISQPNLGFVIYNTATSGTIVVKANNSTGVETPLLTLTTTAQTTNNSPSTTAGLYTGQAVTVSDGKPLTMFDETNATALGLNQSQGVTYLRNTAIPTAFTNPITDKGTIRLRVNTTAGQFQDVAIFQQPYINFYRPVVLRQPGSYIQLTQPGSYIQFPDGSQQTAAYVSPTGGGASLAGNNIFTGTNTFNDLTIASTHSLIVSSTSNISVGTAPNGPTTISQTGSSLVIDNNANSGSIILKANNSTPSETILLTLSTTAQTAPPISTAGLYTGQDVTVTGGKTITMFDTSVTPTSLQLYQSSGSLYIKNNATTQSPLFSPTTDIGAIHINVKSSGSVATDVAIFQEPSISFYRSLIFRQSGANIQFSDGTIQSTAYIAGNIPTLAGNNPFSGANTFNTGTTTFNSLTVHNGTLKSFASIQSVFPGDFRTLDSTQTYYTQIYQNGTICAIDAPFASSKIIVTTRDAANSGGVNNLIIENKNHIVLQGSSSEIDILGNAVTLGGVCSFTNTTTPVITQSLLLTDNSNKIATTAYVRGQGYAQLSAASNTFTGSNTFNAVTVSGSNTLSIGSSPNGPTTMSQSSASWVLSNSATSGTIVLKANNSTPSSTTLLTLTTTAQTAPPISTAGLYTGQDVTVSDGKTLTMFDTSGTPTSLQLYQSSGSLYIKNNATTQSQLVSPTTDIGAIHINVKSSGSVATDVAIFQEPSISFYRSLIFRQSGANIQFSDGTIQSTAYIAGNIPTLAGNNPFTGTNTFNTVNVASNNSLYFINGTTNSSINMSTSNDFTINNNASGGRTFFNIKNSAGTISNTCSITTTNGFNSACSLINPDFSSGNVNCFTASSLSTTGVMYMGVTTGGSYNPLVAANDSFIAGASSLGSNVGALTLTTYASSTCGVRITPTTVTVKGSTININATNAASGTVVLTAKNSSSVETPLLTLTTTAQLTTNATPLTNAGLYTNQSFEITDGSRLTLFDETNSTGVQIVQSQGVSYIRNTAIPTAFTDPITDTGTIRFRVNTNAGVFQDVAIFQQPYINFYRPVLLRQPGSYLQFPDGTQQTSATAPFYQSTFTFTNLAYGRKANIYFNFTGADWGVNEYFTIQLKYQVNTTVGGSTTPTGDYTIIQATIDIYPYRCVSNIGTTDTPYGLGANGTSPTRYPKIDNSIWVGSAYSTLWTLPANDATYAPNGRYYWLDALTSGQGPNPLCSTTAGLLPISPYIPSGTAAATAWGLGIWNYTSNNNAVQYNTINLEMIHLAPHKVTISTSYTTAPLVERSSGFS